MKFLLLALALFATNAHAEGIWTEYRDSQTRAVSVPPGQTLVKVLMMTNDRDSNSRKLSIMLDSNNLITGLYKEEVKGRGNSAFDENDGPAWLRDIESPEGAVLVEGQGRKVILLQGKLKRDTQEGRFQIRYLSNGLSNSYEACDFLLKKKDDGWFIQNAYTNKKVTSAKIITWSLGLTTIEGICPKKR